MEKLILEKIAMELISKIKENNANLKDLETTIANYQTGKISYSNKIELNKIIRLIVEKLKSIINLSESKFILPNKVIDNILVFFIKFLDILFTYKNLSFERNIIANDILPSLLTFLKIEQNYPNGMTRSEFITSKWKFLENILKYSLAFIDIFENDSENNFESSQIVAIFDLVDLIYFNLDSTEYKYKIMPGLISKILKFFSVMKSDLKISSKILKMFIKFFDENVNVIFGNLEEFFIVRNKKMEISHIENFEATHSKNFHTFFEFLELFHLKLHERISKEKLIKILPQLIKLNLNSIQKFIRLSETEFPIIKIDSEVIEKIFQNNFNFLTKLIQLENISTCKNDNIINKEFFSIFSLLYKEEEILEKLHQNISKISRIISRDQLNVSLEPIRELFINLQMYLAKIIFAENFEEINIFTYNSILNNNNNNESLNFLITKLLDEVYLKLFQVKNNAILEIINTYEVQVNNITLEKSYAKFSNYLDQCLKFGHENEYQIIMIIFKFTVDLFPQFKKLILNLILIKINTTTRNFKKILTNEENILDSTSNNPNENKKINIKEFQGVFDVVCQELSLLVTVCFIEKSSEQDFQLKQKFLLKNLINFYAGVLIEYGDELKCISRSKLSLMNSLVMMLYAYLNSSSLSGDKLFTQQELNNVLIFALPNYCNRSGILKYSATFLMSCLINSKNDRDSTEIKCDVSACELNLKNFVYSNFNFVMNTTIKKIIYFDYSMNKTSNSKNTSQISYLSNFKIEILNLFNSLLLLLEEFQDDNLMNFYCGELNKMTGKIFSFLDMYMREKNFFALECLLEIIERITLLQKKVIEKNHAVFKLNHYDDYILSEVDQDSSQFVSFLKQQIGIDDSNLFRNIVLRILPLFFSNKISIQNKCLKIFENLISTLYLLPMSREEKKNFSTEDSSNVIVKSSLGPVMFESWGYFIFLLGDKNLGEKNILKRNLNFFGNIFHFLLVVAEYYPKFFNEQRVFVELLKKVQENFDSVSKSFASIQILKALSPVVIFLNRILDLNFSHDILRDDSQENMLNFLIAYSELISELKSTKRDENNTIREKMRMIPEINQTVTRIIFKINRAGIITGVGTGTQNKLAKLNKLLNN